MRPAEPVASSDRAREDRFVLPTHDFVHAQPFKYSWLDEQGATVNGKASPCWVPRLWYWWCEECQGGGSNHTTLAAAIQSMEGHVKAHHPYRIGSF